MDKKQASEFAENLKEKIGESLNHEDVQAMKETAQEVADSATDFIRKYPLQSVLGAAVVGFALASLLNRRK